MPKGIYSHKPYTEERRLRMISIKSKYKGVPRSEDVKRKISLSKLGYHHSEETIEKMRLSTHKHRPYRVGVPIDCKGNKNGNWRGGITKLPGYVNWQKNQRNRLKGYQISLGLRHTYEEWDILKELYQFMCACCKKQEPVIKLTEDHIIPLSKGGSDKIENIQPLCLSCNIRKHSKIIRYD